MKLEVRNAGFAYDVEYVFEAINLSISDEELFCILGPNGCGKTTLLRCMAGMLKLKRGDILLEGRSIASLKREEIATRVGYIPQEHSPTFPFTVFQVVLMGRAPYLNAFSSPSAKDVAIAEKAIDWVGIRGLRNRRFTEISGGERQLVLIARVLAQQPRILLMDEPTSHLDFRNQTLILRLVSRLTREGIAVVMTTHFPNQAFSHSSRVAIMKEGAFMAVGRPEEVMTEQRLSDTYGIDVRVLTVTDAGRGEEYRVCVPARERPELAGELALSPVERG